MLGKREIQDLKAGRLGRVPGALVAEVGPAVVPEVELNKLSYPAGVATFVLVDVLKSPGLTARLSFMKFSQPLL